MNNDDEKQNKLINLSFLAFASEEKSQTLSNHLPKNIIKSADIFFERVLDKMTQKGFAEIQKLSKEGKQLILLNLKESKLLGLCIFDTRVQFSRNFQDPDMEDINLFELENEMERNNTKEPLSEEIVKLVIESMENGKKVDVIEKTPSYVIKTIATITTKVFLGFNEAQIIDKLTKKESELLFASLNYLISNSYFCGVVYVYLAKKPANNKVQSFVKSTLRIK